MPPRLPEVYAGAELRPSPMMDGSSRSRLLKSVADLADATMRL
jgi:hypothetical protein